MRKTIIIMGGALLSIAIAGCGSTTAANSTSSTSSSVPSVSSSKSTTTAASVIKTGKVSVSGKQTTVLENSKGYTLYYFTKDTPTHSACEANATCAKLWHALKAPSSPAVSGVSGTFSLLNGQVEYQGHPLYTYSGDSGPGQSHGEGFLKEWWVATPSLKAVSTSSSPSSSSSSGGSGGY